MGKNQLMKGQLRPSYEVCGLVQVAALPGVLLLIRGDPQYPPFFMRGSAPHPVKGASPFAIPICTQGARKEDSSKTLDKHQLSRGPLRHLTEKTPLRKVTF